MCKGIYIMNISKEDIVQLLKSRNKTNLVFNRNNYKGLSSNKYHYDQYYTGDLYVCGDPYSTDVFYDADNGLKSVGDKGCPKCNNYVEDICAYYINDLDIILFMMYTSKDSLIDAILDEKGSVYSGCTASEQLIGVFTMKELLNEGFTITVNYKGCGEIA